MEMVAIKVYAQVTTRKAEVIDSLKYFFYR